MITLLVSDYLISLIFLTVFSPVNRFILYFDYCSFAGVDNVSLQVTSLVHVHGFIMRSHISYIFIF